MKNFDVSQNVKFEAAFSKFRAKSQTWRHWFSTTLIDLYIGLLQEEVVRKKVGNEPQIPVQKLSVQILSESSGGLILLNVALAFGNFTLTG